MPRPLPLQPLRQGRTTFAVVSRRSKISRLSLIWLRPSFEHVTLRKQKKDEELKKNPHPPSPPDDDPPPSGGHGGDDDDDDDDGGRGESSGTVLGGRATANVAEKDATPSHYKAWKTKVCSNVASAAARSDQKLNAWLVGSLDDSNAADDPVLRKRADAFMSIDRQNFDALLPLIDGT